MIEIDIDKLSFDGKKLIIFGEKINTINPEVAKALKKKDVEFFRNLALIQLKSGVVDVIDINVGSDIDIEPSNMIWAVTCIEDVVGDKVRLSIDSSNPETIIAGIKQLRDKKSTFINSITLEENKYKKLLPLAKEYDLQIIALPIDQYGIPSTAEKRLKLAIKLVNLVEKYHIDPEKLFIDCLVQPIALSPYNAQVSLDTIRMIKKHILSVKTFICLTAISFGLPERRLINRNFISLLINENIDSIILDPLDKDLIDNIYSIKMLLGKDENCMNYINYIRSR